jgi:hypothetical protein
MSSSSVCIVCRTSLLFLVPTIMIMQSNPHWCSGPPKEVSRVPSLEIEGDAAMIQKISPCPATLRIQSAQTDPWLQAQIFNAIRCAIEFAECFLYYLNWLSHVEASISSARFCSCCRWLDASAHVVIQTPKRSHGKRNTGCLNS